MASHFNGWTVFSVSHIVGITLGAGEKVDEVAGGTSDMGEDRMGELGDRFSEEQAAGVYGAGFTAGNMGNKINFNKELTEFGRMVEGD